LVILVKNLFAIKTLITFLGVFLLIGVGVILTWRTASPDSVSNEAQANQYATPIDYFSQDVNIASVPKVPYLIAGTMEAQVANLQKLAMVWGFTKYTHLAFLTGERCWDEELLGLIPIVRLADPEDVNYILYNWFVGLGDDGFDNSVSMFLFAPINQILSQLDIWNIVDFEELIEEAKWLSLISYTTGIDVPSVILRADKRQLEALSYSDGDFHWLHLLEVKNEEYMRPLVNIEWITDESFLGSSLVSAFSRFNEVPIIDRAVAPISFDMLGFSDFSNQNLHSNMDFQNEGYRLLGLFRLWNAMKYFFPYIDIVDGEWNTLLLEHIPKMLAGTDRLSYELTLMSLASHLHDAHVFFESALGRNRHARFDTIFGAFVPPILFTEAEGHLVVLRQIPLRNYEHMLMPGDVILRVNGVDINAIIAEKLNYVSYPNEEKALFYLTYYMILRQKSNYLLMGIHILRNGIEIEVEVETINRQQYQTLFNTPISTMAHERLDNNIGLINPSRLQNGSTQYIMEYFADTDGLIVDLRQRPGESSFHLILANYLVEEPKPFFKLTKPSQSIPGVFKELQRGYSGAGWWLDSDTYFYDKPVVLLMDERTFSFGETTIMSLRNGSNVTVVGSNSMGANGDIRRLPLPGGVTMNFSSVGVFTPDGDQTQRIGLSPDIRVSRTIAGIRDSRDELMEAAVEFLTGNPFP